jgi:hypothetical protein
MADNEYYFPLFFMNNGYNGMIMQPISCVLMHFLQIIHGDPLFFNELFNILPLFVDNVL